MEQMLSELNDCVPSSDNVEQAIETEQLSGIISGWLDSLPSDDCAPPAGALLATREPAERPSAPGKLAIGREGHKGDR